MWPLPPPQAAKVHADPPPDAGAAAQTDTPDLDMTLSSEDFRQLALQVEKFGEWLAPYQVFFAWPHALPCSCCQLLLKSGISACSTFDKAL